jgi:hypothetical protein
MHSSIVVATDSQPYLSMPGLPCLAARERNGSLRSYSARVTGGGMSRERRLARLGGITFSERLRARFSSTYVAGRSDRSR